MYERSGVKEYWIVDSIQKSIEVFVNTNKKFEPSSTAKSKGEVRSEVLKGLSMPVQTVF